MTTQEVGPPAPASEQHRWTSCVRHEVLREADGGWIARRTIGPETRDGLPWRPPGPVMIDGRVLPEQNTGAVDEVFVSSRAVTPERREATTRPALPEEPVGIGARWAVEDTASRTELRLVEHTAAGAVLAYETTRAGPASARVTGTWRLREGAPFADGDATMLGTARVNVGDAKTWS